ncbi:hypothetical protein C1N61_31165 (plasmid) [Priestia aryabhattai]
MKNMFLRYFMSFFIIILLLGSSSINEYNTVSELDYHKKIVLQNNILTPKLISNYIGLNNINTENNIPINPPAIAVLDSGVYPHKNLLYPQNKILAFKDMINGFIEPYDDFGHGTFISGVIAGNATKEFSGISPHAKIVAVKVIDENGESNQKVIGNAIEWVIENKTKYNIKIINMSFNFHNKEPLYNDEVSTMIRKAEKVGILVVCSSGNKSIYSEDDTAMYPSNVPGVISVGSLEYVSPSGILDRKKYIVADYSRKSYGLVNDIKPTLIVPGTNIRSLNSNTNYTPGDKLVIGNTYRIDTGTSISAAVVSGTLAKLSEAHPDKDMFYIKRLLFSYTYLVPDYNFSNVNRFIYIN